MTTDIDKAKARVDRAWRAFARAVEALEEATGRSLLMMVGDSTPVLVDRRRHDEHQRDRGRTSGMWTDDGGDVVHPVPSTNLHLDGGDPW